MRILVVISILVVLCTCQQKQDHSLQNRLQAFTEFYRNYLQAVASDSSAKESRKALMDSSLRRSGLSENDIKRMITYFRCHPEEFERLLQEVTKDLENNDAGKR
jgi:hypothetical protein